MKLFEFDANIGDWRTLIQTRDIQNGAVRSQHIAGDAVTGDKIAGGEIKSRHIADDAVTGDKIADGTIPGSKLTEGCITGDKIVGGTVKQGKLADNAVAERNIQPHSVTGDKIADGSIRPVHVPQETILHITEDVQNQIDGIQVAGVAVSNEFGNDPHIALSQKKVTETILGQQEAINELESSVGDIVGDAGSDYDSLEKVQNKIEEERSRRQAAEANRYTKEETYSKSEVNGLITTPSQQYRSYEATEQTTSVSDILPATGAADTIYRVGSWDGTQYNAGYYSEYAWSTTSNSYVFLKSDNVGVDEEPTPGSSKSVTSGGVADVNGFHDYNNHEIIEATLDSKDRILSYRDTENVLHEHSIEIEEDLALKENARRKHANRYAVFANATVLLDSEGNDIPQTLAAQKADDMSTIKWTPLHDMPNRFGATFPAGTEVSGTPYSATYEKDKCIGMDVSLETFMTAVNNPFSLLYTERITHNNSMSAWGIIYHGVPDYAGSYYGNVCSDFVSYALGFCAKYHTGFFHYLNRTHKIGRICPMNFQSAKIGDMLYQDGHVAMVSGVKRDDLGRVVSITVTEEGGRFTYRTEYTDLSLFDARLTDRTDPNFYRDICMCKDDRRFTFNPSTFVYNNDICTYAGDKACFNEGELIVINYNLKNTNSSWTAIELYKDNVLIETYRIADIDQSALPSAQRGHALKIANGLEYGDYKARLTDGVNYSDYTTFKVVEANVAVEMLTPNIAKVSFSSANGTPKYINIASSVMGVAHAIYELTEEDIANGYAILNGYELSTQKEVEGLTSGVTHKAKVYFGTSYGRVAGKDNIVFTF